MENETVTPEVTSTESIDAPTEPVTPEPVTPVETVDYQKSFNELKEEHEGLKSKFTNYGGVDGLLKTAEYLTQNERFQKFLKEEQTRNLTGSNEETIDPEQQAGIEMARKIAREEAMKEVKPLLEKAQKEHINNVFKEMDSDPIYGDMWKNYKKEIAEFSKMLPMEKQNSPTVKDLKILFLAAIESRGDTEKIMAKIYENKLNKAKANSISKTGDSIDKSAKRQFSSIKESYLHAVGEN